MLAQETRELHAEETRDEQGSCWSPGKARLFWPVDEETRATESSTVRRIVAFLIEGFAMAGATLQPGLVWRPSLQYPPDDDARTAAPGGLAVAGRGEFPAYPTPTGEGERRLGLWERVCACYARLRQARELRRATVALEELDDRTLRDLGIHRDQIWSAVRFGRWH